MRARASSRRWAAKSRRCKPGDHVICSWNPHCGHCFYCERDLPILCEPFSRNQPRGLLLDGRSRMSRDGATVHHYSVTSTHAQYTVVPESGAIAIPKEIAFDRACIIGCGVMTGVGAAVRKAKVEAGANVVVIGCGAVGLNVIQGAKLVDAGQIIAVDVGAQKLDARASSSAPRTLSIAARAMSSDRSRRLRRRGADYVFEAAGHDAHLPAGGGSGAPGRTGGLAGQGERRSGGELSLGLADGRAPHRALELWRCTATARFPVAGATNILQGRLQLDALITRRIALAEINEASRRSRSGEGIRTVVMFD